MKPEEVNYQIEQARDWAKKITGWNLYTALPAELTLPDGQKVKPGDNGSQISYGDKSLEIGRNPKFSS
jgi:hypothetical protein